MQGADVIISAVVSKEIIVAARNVAPHLSAGQYYLDINSTSPAAKKEAAAIVEASSACFVEAAVMDLVPPHGHKVTMLLAGNKSQALQDVLLPYGMNVKSIGTEIGNASSVKMVRSVFMKGFTSILLESLHAAHKLNAEDAVLESLQVTFPGMDWKDIADFYASRLILHAKRQSEEMHSVSDTMRGHGVEPIASDATSRRLA